MPPKDTPLQDYCDQEPLLTSQLDASKFRRRNSVLKCVVVVLFLSCLALSIYVAVLRTGYKDQGNGKPGSGSKDVCMSSACVSLAGHMVSALNKSVDPCDDFYEYACGGWRASHIATQTTLKVSPLTVMTARNNERLQSLLTSPGSAEENSTAIAKLKLLYASCMDTQSMDQVGPMPVRELIQLINQSDFNVTRAYLTLAQTTIDHLPFFTMTPMPDEKNTSRRLVHFKQADLGLDVSLYSWNDSDSRVSKYKTYMRSTLSLLDDRSMPAEYYGNLTEAVYGFEKQIAAFMLSREEQLNPNTTYNLMSIDSLAGFSPAFDFVELLSSMVESNRSAIINGSTEVIVESPEYMANISQLILAARGEDNGTAILNYMVWAFVRDLLPYMGVSFRAVAEAYRSSSPLSERCVVLANKLMDDAVGRLFVDHYLADGIKQEVIEMVEYMKINFKVSVETLAWMDDATKKLTKEKADYLIPLIGYSKDIVNNTWLDMTYQDYNITDCFLCNYLSIGANQRTLVMDRLHKPVRRDTWFLSTDTANAAYLPALNIMQVPAGILQSPVYLKDSPLVVKYGSLGSVLGRELMHGFDNTGSQFDKDGNLRSWWPQNVRKAFNNRTQCIARQYSDYTADGQRVDGNLTLGENIADHGGVRVAFHTYRAQSQVQQDTTAPLPGLQHMTNDQLFFLSYAQFYCSNSLKQYEQALLLNDEHAPDRIRVLGTLSTSQPFVDAWKCGAGSRMNRANKCPLW
eukprot:scpid51129/ scgid27355/ Endothelin-converting enzyme 1